MNKFIRMFLFTLAYFLILFLGFFLILLAILNENPINVIERLVFVFGVFISFAVAVIFAQLQEIKKQLQVLLDERAKDKTEE